MNWYYTAVTESIIHLLCNIHQTRTIQNKKVENNKYIVQLGASDLVIFPSQQKYLSPLLNRREEITGKIMKTKESVPISKTCKSKK